MTKKTKHTPNPLPCGCGVMGTPGFNEEGTRIEYKRLHVKFCRKHAAAPKLYAALKAALPALQARYAEHGCEAYRKSFEQARAALQKAGPILTAAREKRKSGGLPEEEAKPPKQESWLEGWTRVIKQQ